MKICHSAIFLGLTLAYAATPAVAADPPAGTTAVIVVLRPETPFHQYTQAAPARDDRVTANPPAWLYLDRGVLGAVRRLETLRGFKAKQVYSNTIKGFAVDLTPEQIESLKAEPTVAYIEPDMPMSIVDQTLPWGVDGVEADRSSTVAGDGTGAVSGVNVYVIDTGVAAHEDLNLVNHVSFAEGVDTDCQGHGTHVAGTIGALDNDRDVVGVAPGVPLTGVKVLDCSGNGMLSNVLKGVDWVTANAVMPAVANMSLGGGASQALDDAVKSSASNGIFYAIAAGNSGVDACRASPARAGRSSDGTDNGIVTTAAVDKDSNEPAWSNYGQCVDIWSPGVGIVSTQLGGGTSAHSGTSMAAPHTAGAAALYLSGNKRATPSQVEIEIRKVSRPTGNLSKDGQAINLLQSDRF